MRKEQFSSFVSKLAVSMENHLDDVQLFDELKEECILLLEEFRNENYTSYDTLRSLMYFNVEVKQLIDMKLENEIDGHHSISALKFIAAILDCEITILRDCIECLPKNCNLMESVKLPKNPKSAKLYRWTGDSIEIVEVVEAMLLLGSINNGNVTKREFFAYISDVLNVDLSNHNKILYDLRYRNDDFSVDDNRIRYLHKMIVALSRKLKQLDNKNKR